jgi:F-type H+-transporting ATPase subunit b
MRWLLLTASLVLAGLVLVATTARSHGAEPEKKEGAKPRVYVYEEGNKEFDLSREKDQHELIDLLQHQDVDHLSLKKERTFLEDLADLAIWTVVIFLILFFILWRFAWKPILEGLHKREHNIQAAVEDAQHARDDAQKLRTQLQEEMARSESKVQQMIEEGRRNAQSAADDLVSKAKAEVSTERERLHREIDTARDQALQEIWNKTADLAARISGKALGRMVTPEDQRRLNDEALNELPRRNGH